MKHYNVASAHRNVALFNRDHLQPWICAYTFNVTQRKSYDE